MSNITNFDVLIVYTEALAVSAASRLDSERPFPCGSRNESYNTVYGYFMEVCEKNGLVVAFTTSADIIGAGLCRSFWSFVDKEWKKNTSACFSNLIFDKFSPTRAGIKSRRELLFSSNEVKSFNDPDLFNLFFDKQKTYAKLAEYAIPAVSLEDSSIEGVDKACKALADLTRRHCRSADFSQDIVMKDRFGAGGRHIYKFKAGRSEDMLAILRKYRRISFIIQPFTKFDQGFSYHNAPASTDIRLIYLNGRIAQSYIRVAKPNDFRCNEHQGGLLTYLSLKEIPKEVINKANLIAKQLDKKGSLYALDFIVSNNGNTYLLEGNTGPGLDWNISLKKNEIEAKKLIRLVAKELVARVEMGMSYEREMVISDKTSTSSELNYSISP